MCCDSLAPGQHCPMVGKHNTTGKESGSNKSGCQSFLGQKVSAYNFINQTLGFAPGKSSDRLRGDFHRVGAPAIFVGTNFEQFHFVKTCWNQFSCLVDYFRHLQLIFERF